MCFIWCCKVYNTKKDIDWCRTVLYDIVTPRRETTPTSYQVGEPTHTPILQVMDKYR